MRRREYTTILVGGKKIIPEQKSPCDSKATLQKMEGKTFRKKLGFFLPTCVQYIKGLCEQALLFPPDGRVKESIVVLVLVSCAKCTTKNKKSPPHSSRNGPFNSFIHALRFYFYSPQERIWEEKACVCWWEERER